MPRRTASEDSEKSGTSQDNSEWENWAGVWGVRGGRSSQMVRHGSQMGRHGALLPQIKKVVGLIPGLGHFYVEFACSQCVCLRGFSSFLQQLKNMHVLSIWDLKLSIGVNVSAKSCLSVCGPAKNWRLFQGVTLPSPYDSWERLQQTPVTLILGTSWHRKWTKEWSHIWARILQLLLPPVFYVVPCFKSLFIFLKDEKRRWGSNWSALQVQGQKWRSKTLPGDRWRLQRWHWDILTYGLWWHYWGTRTSWLCVAFLLFVSRFLPISLEELTSIFHFSSKAS